MNKISYLEEVYKIKIKRKENIVEGKKRIKEAKYFLHAIY